MPESCYTLVYKEAPLDPSSCSIASIDRDSPTYLMLRSRLVPAMKLSSWIALLLSPSISLAADPNATGSVIVQENATTTASNGSSVANPSAFATTISIDLKRKNS